MAERDTMINDSIRIFRVITALMLASPKGFADVLMEEANFLPSSAVQYEHV